MFIDYYGVLFSMKRKKCRKFRINVFMRDYTDIKISEQNKNVNNILIVAF